MGKLYVVPTPIGNLEDITFRAVKILKEVQLILAEDTRTSSLLLKHYNIGVHMESHHKFNEHKSIEAITSKMLAGMNIALISDAGTPAISDPGFLLVRSCLEMGIKVETLPGATALIPALVNSGLPCDRFCFEGFLPLKKGRQTRIKELATEPRTIVIYESPYRLVKTINQMAHYFGSDREAAISRELTKMFEENRRGSLKELAEYYDTNPPKGEIVLIISGYKKKSTKKEERYNSEE